jgi:triphosphoribosyl-dephospho-CoA synthase
MAHLDPHPRDLTIGQCATLACLLEVSAPKPGNVHRDADFEDVTFVDFCVSSVAIAPAMECACQIGIGPAVLQAIRATRRLVATNTNLGTVLLLAPLAATPTDQPLAQGVQQVLESLSPQDCVDVYEAIRLANPGGLGHAPAMDVVSDPPRDLRLAMQAAAERDMVAAQYSNGFSNVMAEVVPSLVDGPGRGWSLTDTIIYTQMRLLSSHGDSLIGRKCGQQVSREAAARATAVLAAGQPGEAAYSQGLADLDFWMRSDGHRRNPGTTADLIAAGLFAGLRDGILQPPY